MAAFDHVGQLNPSNQKQTPMGRKVIIDCDMGIDDAIAICMTLFDPRLEVLAITATEGCVAADQANHNLQAIISELDPIRYPRLGMAGNCDNAPAVNTSYLFGEDGLGNTGFEVSQRQHALTSEKLIGDIIRAHPDEVTILCLGPLTNVAKAFKRDPSLVGSVDQIAMTGGSTSGKGNISAAAEFNFYFDPQSAREVLNCRATKMLLPLDVTEQVSFGLGVLDELPEQSSRLGHFLRQILPFVFRAYRQQLGRETINLNDAIGALALLEPQLFGFEMMAGDVETQGELTRGTLVLDRRAQPESRPNVNVATSVRSEDAYQYLVDQLVTASRQA